MATGRREDRGPLAYGEAKADYDGVIAGLVVALARKGQPASLPDLEARLQRGFDKRAGVLPSVEPLVPPTPRREGPDRRHRRAAWWSR